MPRDELPDDVEIVEFFGMRDLQGNEQYSYLIKSQSKMEKRGEKKKKTKKICKRNKQINYKNQLTLYFLIEQEHRLDF